MLKFKFVLPLFFLVLCFQTTFGQRRLGGRIIEVLDGKTVAVKLYSGGKITVELQYIEIPEAEQPLHQTVKEHLETLVLDRDVELRPQGLNEAKTIGQIYLNGVDVGQQMLRDGAAWYNAEDQNGQDKAESAVYLETEKQAKLEKLGVWSIEGLKPAWEVRAERVALERQREKLAWEKAAKEKASVISAAAANRPKTAARPELSSESQILAATSGSVGQLPPYFKNVGGLLIGYEPTVKLGMILTPLYRTAFPDKDGFGTFSFQALYMYYDANESRGRQSVYIFGIDSVSKDFRFLKDNDLIVTADGQKIVIGKAKRQVKQGEQSIVESLVYQIKKPVLAKIAAAKNLSIKVGDFSKNLDPSMQIMLNNLLQASE